MRAARTCCFPGGRNQFERALSNISNDDKINLMKDEIELELLLSFDGASYHASEGYVIEFTGGKYVKAPAAYDHWHRDERDAGRPYKFTTALQLLDDFWREVKRVMNERGIPNEL